MSEDFVPTRASLMKTEPQQPYEETTYVAYKPRRKEKSENSKSLIEKTVDTEFNMRKVKHEVVKFGMSGFNHLKKEEAKIQQLVKLGAKPPRNKFKNYKLLMKERKAEKEKQAKEQQFQQLGKNSAGKSLAKGKSFDRKRKKEGILDIYGKIVRSAKNK